MAHSLSFSTAVRGWAFVQLPLVELDQFRKQIRLRGLSDLRPFARSPWETLDREGLICPVAYALHAGWSYDIRGCLENGDLLIRDETGFVSWDALEQAASKAHAANGDIQILYHHWQILAVAELQELLSSPTPWQELSEGFEGFAKLRHDHARESALPSRSELADRAQQWRALELQLVQVQNTLWPFELGGPGRVRWNGSPVAGLTDDAATWAREQHRTTDYAALAKASDLDEESLLARYEQLAYAGRAVDPNIGIFGLLNQVKRGYIENLRGPARLAWDYYDAARMFLRWYQLASGNTKDVPDIDDLGGVHGLEAKRQRYGTTDLRANRAVLPQILEDYGIYPWRVHLVTEGDSELALIREVLEQGYGLSFERLGVLTTDVGGADVPPNAELLLASFRTYANYFLLVFDNEGRAAEIVEALKRSSTIEGIGDKQKAAALRRLIAAARTVTNPEARQDAIRAARDQANSTLESEPGAAPEFVIWKDNLEADNFAEHELCAVTTAIMRSQLEVSTTIETSDLDAARSEYPDKGVASLLVILAERRGVTLSKTSLARALALYALAHPEYLGDRRPVLRLVEHLVRLTRADRSLRGKLRD